MTIYRQMDDKRENLAKNLVKLRKLKTFSQLQLAKLADLPRTTLSSIESGSGNPTLANLLKIASALGVSIEELLASPKDPISLVKKMDLSVKRKLREAKIFDLLPEPVANLDLEQLELQPYAYLGGNPHSAHSKEYFICLTGKVEITVAGRKFELSKGDVLIFPGNSKHSYKNTSGKIATGVSVIHRG